MLIDKTVSQLLDEFSSPSPTPGGGSAAALAGAIGASLLAMVAGLPKTKTGTPEARAALDDARTRLLALRETLAGLVDRDAAAYDLVMAAYKRPKVTDEEKAARKEAIQAAMRHATEVPIETMRACAEALSAGVAVAEHGNASAVSDAIVGAGLLMQAFYGGVYNVEVNLGSLSDAQAVERITETLKALVSSAGGSVQQIHQSASFADLVKAAALRMGRPHHDMRKA